MQAASAGRLDQARQAEVGEQFAQRERRVHGVAEPVRRIEVEEHLVGALGPVDAGEPGMQGHSRLIGQVEQRRLVRAQDVGDLAVLLRHRHPLHPGRGVRRGGLLEERARLDPVRVAGQGERTVVQLREHPPGHRAVVLDQLALGDPGLGEEHLVQVREFDLFDRRGHVRGSLLAPSAPHGGRRLASWSYRDGSDPRRRSRQGWNLGLRRTRRSRSVRAR